MKQTAFWHISKEISQEQQNEYTIYYDNTVIKKDLAWN